MEFTLLANVAVAIAAGWLMLRLQGAQDTAAAAEAAVTAAAAGILGGRLIDMLGDGVAPWLHPADVILVRAGVSTVGASIVAVVVFLVLCRRSPLPMADLIAAPVLAALSGWHAGCVTRAACLGTPSRLPWAIAQGDSPLTRHPVEIYAALLLAAAAVGLAVWRRRAGPAAGVTAALAVAAAAATRLATEPMRPSLFGGPVVFYGAAVAGGLAAAALLQWRQRRSTLTPR